MKMTILQKSIIALLILLFAILSFGPCIRVTTNYFVVNPIDLPYVEYKSYLPLFCCVISLLELFLLFYFKRTWSIIAGLVLNLIKTAAPLPLISLFKATLSMYGGLTWESYSYGWLGYLLLGLGLLIETIELTSLFSKRKNI